MDTKDYKLPLKPTNSVGNQMVNIEITKRLKDRFFHQNDDDKTAIKAEVQNDLNTFIDNFSKKLTLDPETYMKSGPIFDEKS